MKKIISLLLATVMVFALCACGEKAAPTAAPAEAAVAAPEAETADAATLNVSDHHWRIGGQPRNTSLYLYYAESLGLFKEAGVDMEIVTLANGPALNESSL